MKYTNLGRSGLSVSRLVLGTMNFGPKTSEQDSYAIMDKALEEGVQFFDTADVYGWKFGEGWTEQIVGRWMAQGGGRRERIVLATKVYNPMWEGPNGKGLSAYHIRRACEDSLQRLQTDHIDLYQMHHIDRTVPIEEIWQAMEQLVREGKVLYVGSSNFPGWYLAKAQMTARQRHFLGLVSEQPVYNLENRNVELEVLPAAQDLGIGIIPWSPLSGGLLAGILDKEEKGRRGDDQVQSRIESRRGALEKWESFCKKRGEEPAHVALAWLLAQPAVTAPIIGPRTLDQLTGALHALDIELSQDDLDELDAIWPGPGGPAPEAYSW